MTSTIPDASACLAAAALVLAPGTPAAADDIVVPGDAPTIAAAVAIANAGDVILLEDGLFQGPDNRDVTITGTSLTIRAASGVAGAVVVDCESQGRFLDILDADVLLENLEIRNGNAAGGDGGGVLVQDTEGGLNARLRASGCTFQSCAAGRGGGVRIEDLAGVTRFRALELSDCRFRLCSAAFGAGVDVDSTQARLDRCRFESCAATNRGGAIRAHNDPGFLTDVEIASTLIVGNVAGDGGGGVAFDVGAVFGRLDNCTVADNTTTGFFAGLWLAGSDNLVRNSIVWSNGSGSEIDQILLADGTVSSTIVEGLALLEGNDNLGLDPGFLAPGANDYRVGSGSPAVDSGNNGLISRESEQDVAGEARRLDDPATPDRGVGEAPIVDRGAYEFRPECVGDTNGDGLVNVNDLINVIFDWGTNGEANGGDTDGSGFVNVNDLVTVVLAWGECG